VSLFVFGYRLLKFKKKKHRLHKLLVSIMPTTSSLRGGLRTPLTRLFCGDFTPIVIKVTATEQKFKFWVVLLFGLGHLFEVRSIACNKHGQLVDDRAQFVIYEKNYKNNITKTNETVLLRGMC